MRPAAMLARAFIAALALTALCAPPAIAVSDHPHAATVLVEFDARRITHFETKGLADEAANRPVTIDDPVRIASISKLITAFGVDALVQRGKLNLDKDLSDYLGWRLRNPTFPDTPITLRMLLSHRSSLDDGGEYVIPLGTRLRDFVVNPKSWDSAHRPGSWFHYTNLNFPIVASVMEAATGERFDRLMMKLVFRPLRLDACFNWSGCSDAKVKRAVVLRSEEGAVRRDDLKGKRPDCLVYASPGAPCELNTYHPSDNGGLFSPQGGARISMRDLAKIGQYLWRNQKRLLGGDDALLAKSSAILTGETENGFNCRYGLAIHVIAASTAPGCRDDLFGDGHVRFGHAGEAYGLRSGLWVDIKTGKGVAFFTSAVPDDAKSGTSAFTFREEEVVRRKTK